MRGVILELYSGSSEEFVSLTWGHHIADILETAFVDYFGRYPSPSEKNSWQHSLEALCAIIKEEKLLNHGIALEYSLPQSSRRLDCMITGVDSRSTPHAVVVELKQWTEVGPSAFDECVTTFVGGRHRDVLHPSVQVGQYQQYLTDTVTAFSSGAISLASCSYLHNRNASEGGELFAQRHASALSRYPIFCADEKPEFGGFLRRRLSGGEGMKVLSTVAASRFEPTKKLLGHVAKMVEHQRAYVLLDEQRVVYQSVLHEARQAVSRPTKTAVIVRGGPGTGKSVVALTLVGALSKAGVNVRHATGSRAFTEHVRQLVGSRASVLFNYFNSYTRSPRDCVDVLILDEAHRIRKTSANRFTRAQDRPDRAQVDELVEAAKVSVFFLDDLQVVRPGEVGSVDLIREAAGRAGARVLEYDLEAQFRCSGSEAFINWVDDLLGVRVTANPVWFEDDPFDFRIVDSPRALQGLIVERAREGFAARLTAGFCWPWSDPSPDGTLIHDVQIGDWSMPWNAKPEAGRLVGVPRAQLWASDPRGIDQVGCVYTAQGFEYDYAGVIFGEDLRFDPDRGEWMAERTRSYDRPLRAAGSDFDRLVRHVYRVLLTRGMRGCYVYFMDEATRDFVKGRIRPRA